MFNFLSVVLSIGLLSPGLVGAQAPIAPIPSHEHSANAFIKRMYSRITGLSMRDSEAESIRIEVTQPNGKISEKALFDKLFADRGFVEGRLASYVSQLSNEESEPFEDVDDFQVALTLQILSNTDLRNVFTKPFAIETIGQPKTVVVPTRGRYQVGEELDFLSQLPTKFALNYAPVSSKDNTVDRGYYWDGLFSTAGFGARFLSEGTNRKAIRGIFNVFLCRNIDSWKDASLDPFHIGRDVDRKPGDKVHQFNEGCRACHAPMDAMRGAFAYYNFNANDYKMEVTSTVQDKYNQNRTVYDKGDGTLDDLWEILLTTPEHQKAFGWRGNTNGHGVKSYAKAIVDSRQFSNCMTRKLVATFCDMTEIDATKLGNTPQFQTLVQSFITNGYKTKTLIKDIVRSRFCQ